MDLGKMAVAETPLVPEIVQQSVHKGAKTQGAPQASGYKPGPAQYSNEQISPAPKGKKGQHPKAAQNTQSNMSHKKLFDPVSSASMNNQTTMLATAQPPLPAATLPKSNFSANTKPFIPTFMATPGFQVPAPQVQGLQQPMGQQDPQRQGQAQAQPASGPPTPFQQPPVPLHPQNFPHRQAYQQERKRQQKNQGQGQRPQTAGGGHGNQGNNQKRQGKKGGKIVQMNGQIDFNQFNAPVRRAHDQEDEAFYTNKNPDDAVPEDQGGGDGNSKSSAQGNRGGKGKKKILTFGAQGQPPQNEPINKQALAEEEIVKIIEMVQDDLHEEGADTDIEQYLKVYKKLEKFLQNQLKMQHVQINRNTTEKAISFSQAGHHPEKKQGIGGFGNFGSGSSAHQQFQLSRYYEQAREAMIKMYEDSIRLKKKSEEPQENLDEAATPEESTPNKLISLFPIELVDRKRFLKRLWAIIHLDVQNKEDILKYHGKHSVSARDEYFNTIEFYFQVLKRIFSELYRDRNPLSTELKFENAVRALSAQHLLHLGDLCKLKTKHQNLLIDAKTQYSLTQMQQQEKGSKGEEAWNFYTRAKTVYPFDGRIYSSFALLCQKDQDRISTIYFLARALACDIPHESSRDILIDQFEEARTTFVQLKQQTNRKGGGQANRQDRNQLMGREESKFMMFMLTLLRIQGILYTKIGIDEMDEIWTSLFTHLIHYLNDIEKQTNKLNEVQTMVHISFILIFIAHACISDASRDLEQRQQKNTEGDPQHGQSEEDILKLVFKQTLPSLALKQVSEMCILVVDKVFKIPSDWLKFLMPPLLWLTLHVDDGLLDTLFELSPTFRQEMTRLHQLLEKYIEEQSKVLKLDQDEEKQMKILQLIGATLLPEENMFLGFLPMKSYLAQTKTLNTGSKCPQEKEELIRAHILKDALEKLGCTIESLKDASKISKQSKQAKMKEEDKSEDDDDDIFQQIDEQNLEDSEATLGKPGRNLGGDYKPLIVLDAQNVAMKHGRDKMFSTKGIHIAINYWMKNGHKVVCFLPEYLFDYDQVNRLTKEREYGQKVKESKIPDNVPFLCKMLEMDLLVKTPSQDYDDSYSIQYARKFNAFMVTNDKFRDYLAKFKDRLIAPTECKSKEQQQMANASEQADQAYIDAAQKKKSPKKKKNVAGGGGQQDNAGNYDFTELKNEEKWIKAHSISYTFNKDEFLPNPDSKIWHQKNCKYEEYRNFPLDII